MRKNVWQTGIVLGLLAQLACAADSGIVGVRKISCAAGFAMTAQSWNNGSTSIQDVISNLQDLTGTTDTSTADKIHIFNGLIYDAYGLFNHNGTNVWVAQNDGAWTHGGDPVYASVMLTPGTGFWLELQNAADVVLRGTVCDDADVVLQTEESGTYTMMGYPFSADVALNELSVSNATASTSFTAADKLYLWNGQTYEKYALYDNDGAPVWISSASYSWRYGDAPVAATAVIRTGQAFWYQSAQASKDLGFSSVYTLD